MLCINSINISQRFLLIDFKFFGGSIIHWIRGNIRTKGLTIVTIIVLIVVRVRFEFWEIFNIPIGPMKNFTLNFLGRRYYYSRFGRSV